MLLPRFDHENRIVIQPLPPDLGVVGLNRMFHIAGEVCSVEVADDGRSAIVEMATPENAEDAITLFDGSDYDGLTVRVYRTEA